MTRELTKQKLPTDTQYWEKEFQHKFKSFFEEDVGDIKNMDPM
jgi:hypothetical protein